jgi:DnaJ-class molecular chaperone
MNFDRFKEPDRELSHHEHDPEQRRITCPRCKGLGCIDDHNIATGFNSTMPCDQCHGVGTIDL